MAYDTAIVIGLQAVAFCFFYLSMNMEGDRHGPLQILFTIFGFYITLTNIDIMAKIANANAQTAIENVIYSDYTLMLYTVLFFVAYVFILVVWEALQKFWVRKRAW